ncbi:MAG: PQQ-binding-like beta-propeller repeat protein [Candidatus Bathyarchaeota archaeon]|nr:PQQ-binding-like beta-propeller repeat protein [Candidatus Bathyarchaeota archaeon]
MMPKVITRTVLIFFLVGMLIVALYAPAKRSEARTIHRNNSDAYDQLETGSLENSFDSKGNGWTMFQHDPAHTGYTESEAPHTPNVLWKRKVSTMDPRHSVVTNGRIFFGSGTWGRDGFLYCLDENTGNLLWKREFYDWVYSIAEDKGKIFVGAINLTYVLLYCLDEMDGRVLWSYNSSEMDGDRIYEATPTGITPTDGRIYVNVYVEGENHGYLLCLNETTGALLWNFPLIDEHSRSSPAVEENRVFIIGHGEEWINETFSIGHSHLYCVNATTGKLIWKLNLNLGPPIVEWPLSIAYGKAFAPFSDTKIACVNVADGEIIWEYEIPDYTSSVSCFAVAYGDVFVGSYRRLDVVNGTNGELIWGVNGTKAGIEFGWTVPLIAESRLYLSTSYPQGVWCFNATTGERLWNYLTATRIIGTAGSGSIWDGKLFIPLFDGDYSYLFCFEDSGEGVAVWPFVTDSHCDVGSTQTIYFHGIWTYNGSPIKDGTIFINGTEYVANSSGWINFNHTSTNLAAVSWVVTAVNCSGVTRYFQMAPIANVVWDSIIVFDGGVTPSFVDVREWVTIWFKAAYEYNNEDFYGLLFVNGSATSYSDTDERWEHRYRATTLGTITFEVTSASDKKYGLKTINDIAGTRVVTVRTPFPWWIIGVALTAGIALIITGYFLKKRKTALGSNRTMKF